jgi:hypothetical protein
MERDEQAKAEVEQPEETAEEDTEGHSLGVVMAMNEILGGGSKAKRTYRREPEEEIRPINKTFPRMREEKRR